MNRTSLHTTLTIVFACFLVLLPSLVSMAQTRTVIGGNIVNSAITGTAVGLSVMGMQNDAEIAPLRIGLGSGILIGVGLAAYDLSDSEGGELVVSGVLNDGQNTSVILLLDTLYGGALGAAIGSATALIANEPQVEGLQYGSSAGVLAGFAFGLLDAFTMAERRVRAPSFGASARGANGLLTVMHNNWTLDIASASLIAVPDFDRTHGKRLEPGISLLSLKAQF